MLIIIIIIIIAVVSVVPYLTDEGEQTAHHKHFKRSTKVLYRKTKTIYKS